MALIKGPNQTRDGVRVELYAIQAGQDFSLDSPVSAELERRGVLRRGSEQHVTSSAGRGRRAHTSRVSIT